MALIYPVILCGGSGTRLWPLSRQSMPKQFLNLIGEGSLFQQAAQRVSGSQFASPLVITSNEYRFIVAQQLADIGVEPSRLVLEPSAKNTAPAIVAAAEILSKENMDSLLLVMPSDQYIPDYQALADLVLSGKSSAEAGSMVTFGIMPDRPETGYGYIEKGEKLTGFEGYAVAAFHEKPLEKRAQAMLDSGNYFWNSGLLLANCGQLLELAEELAPDILSAVKQSVARCKRDLDFLRLEEVSWNSIKADSIDYTLLEKADRLAVFPYSGRWSDLGDWHALHRELSNNKIQSVERQTLLIGNSIQLDSASCLIWSDYPKQLVTAVGVKDLIIVATSDAVMVVDKKRTQDVRALVDKLERRGQAQAKEQLKKFRPWGWFEELFSTESYQIRRVQLYPNKSLSLQFHKNCSEHWVVVSGEAEVELERETKILRAGEGISIPAGYLHRLKNNFKVPLILLETRFGDHLNDDTHRLYQHDN